jgi:hypothetical protein
MLQNLGVAATRAARFLAAAAFLCAPTHILAQERPWSVSPCELLKNPGMYTETLVSVPGVVLVGPEQFTAHGYDCADNYGVLPLEFGGNPSDPKDRFRLPMTRLEASTVPLKKDADYDTMQRLINSASASGQTKMLRATLIGRFFPGPAVGNKAGEVGHPNPRLVISEVELVSNRIEDPVDFSPLARTIVKPAKDCETIEIAVPSRDDEDRLQRLSREPSEGLDYLGDPTQVAGRAIAAQEHIAADEVASQLRPGHLEVALKNYTWTTTDGLRTYEVTVNRPYWLLPSTYTGDTVIWAPKHIVRSVCSDRVTH